MMHLPWRKTITCAITVTAIASSGNSRTCSGRSETRRRKQDSQGDAVPRRNLTIVEIMGSGCELGYKTEPERRRDTIADSCELPASWRWHGVAPLHCLDGYCRQGNNVLIRLSEITFQGPPGLKSSSGRYGGSRSCVLSATDLRTDVIAVIIRLLLQLPISANIIRFAPNSSTTNRTKSAISTNNYYLFSIFPIRIPRWRLEITWLRPGDEIIVESGQFSIPTKVANREELD